MKKDLSPSEFRKLCKEAKITTHSSGYCPGYAQANILVLPKQIANDFIGLCERNPVPCPLLGKTISGTPHKLDNNDILDDVNFDFRTDLPKYRIFQNGKYLKETTDVLKEWDLNYHVGFLIGCSFSFEKALTDAGLPPKNVINKTNVSMYRTKRQLDPSGIFTDITYVVSMRPYKIKDIPKVRLITKQFKRTHGEPIDWGYDAIERLGVNNIYAPEYGDSCSIDDDEVPVFWGCGVTAQDAALKIGEKIDGKIMAHAPGHMLILDIKDSEINVL
jgi:uncharacterized protein YcsI (UPF0317 family)